MAQLSSWLEWNSLERKAVWNTLSAWAKDKKESKIVRVNAIQSLFDLTIQCPELKNQFQSIVSAIKSENIPSLNARLKKLGAL